MSAPSLTKWTVFWAFGPVDDPTDGQTDVEAESIAEAEDRFHRFGRTPKDTEGWNPTITAIIRSDCVVDFT